MKTMHGAEIWAAFQKAGGTKARWDAKVVPIMRKAGPGPLYKLSDETLAAILAVAAAHDHICAGCGRVWPHDVTPCQWPNPWRCGDCEVPTKPLAEMSVLERVAFLNDLEYSDKNVKSALLDAFNAGRLAK